MRIRYLLPFVVVVFMVSFLGGMFRAENCTVIAKPLTGQKVQLVNPEPNEEVSYKYGNVQFWKDEGGGTYGNVNLIDEGPKVKLSGDLASYDGSQIALILPFDTPQDIRKIKVLLNGNLEIGQTVSLKLTSEDGSVLKSREIATDALDRSIQRMADVDFDETVKGVSMALLSVSGNGAAGSANLTVQGLGGMPPSNVSIVTAIGVQGSYTDNTLGEPFSLNKARLLAKDNGIEISGILNSESNWLGLGFRFNDLQDINLISLLLKGEIPSGQKLKVKVYGKGRKLLKDYLIGTQTLTNESMWQASIDLGQNMKVREIDLLILYDGTEGHVDLEVIGLGNVTE